jgi:peroxiredoxin
MAHKSEMHRTGDRAPDFTLPTQKGDSRPLSDYLKKGPVLLAFHRGTW